MTEIQNSKHVHDLEEPTCLTGLGHWILACDELSRVEFEICL